MRTREQKIYGYSELTGTAKERARAWIIEGMWDFLQDDLREMFQEVLTEKGFPGTKVWFSLGHVQGDGVTFDLKHFDLGAWLEAQSRTSEFRMLYQGDVGHSLNIYIHSDRRGFNPPKVSVEPTFHPDPREERAVVALEEAIQESIDDVCSKMTNQGYEFIAANEDDEAVTEHAEANEYEFDEMGRPA